MRSGFSKFFCELRRLITQEHGQDLVEYALVVAMIAFGATAGMKALASGLNSTFGDVSSKLGSYVS
jgi:pilus assembly protein Flp/PilA